MTFDSEIGGFVSSHRSERKSQFHLSLFASRLHSFVPVLFPVLFPVFFLCRDSS